MPRRLPTLLLVAAFAAPMPVAAGQAMAPAAVVAGAPKMATLASPTVRKAPKWLRPAPRLLPRPSGFERRSRGDEAPEFELRAKAEWFEEEDLRIGPTKIAYRKRF